MPTIANPTTCRYFKLDTDGNVTSPQREFAWPDATDRKGDGEAEAEAFIANLIDWHADGLTRRPDVLAAHSDIDNHAIQVWQYCWDATRTPTLFGLAVVDATGYWDTDTETWVDTTR